MRQQVIIGVVVLIGMLGGTTSGQEPPDTIMPGQAQPAPPQMAPALPMDFQVGMLAVEPFALSDPVKNAPYSAEIVNEVTQQLRDGNRIERRSTGMVARDSRGRVRREQQLAAIGPVVPDNHSRMVTISDPEAGVHYALDPVRKVAIRSRPPRTRTMAPGQPAPIILEKRTGSEVGLQVPGAPGAGDVRTEQLGTKEYEGVRAEGTRTIGTLPAGAIGNVRPIEIVSERWYSPELHVVVYSRRADPRFGETTYRLTNITRAEPDASLFQVPPDYKREDTPPRPFEPMVVKPLP
jgi:hypothetical protein